MSTIILLCALPELALIILYGYCLFKVIKDFKGQLANPYTKKDFTVEFNSIKKTQMFLVLSSLITLIISLMSPAYRYAGNIGNYSNYADTVSLFDYLESLQESSMFFLFLMFICLVLCVIYLRLSRMAYYFPLVAYMILNAILIYAVHSNIKVGNLTIGDAVVASAGKHGGLGYYLLIASLLCSVATIVVLLFRNKKRPHV